MFAEVFQTELELIDHRLRKVLGEHLPCPSPGLKKFWECMEYSLLSEGKRFRPLLALLTARTLDQPIEKAWPMAGAVELIHTYSLIHDDLPLMDNDDFRRGRPTNHKVYGEVRALLAGDALLTAAFGVLAESDSRNLSAALRALADAAGPVGMVGGQVLDVGLYRPDEAALAEVHKRKTGALIRVSVEGTAILLGAQPEETADLREYGEALGLAFQLADDIQDFDPAHPEKVSYVSRIGLDATKKCLNNASDRALRALTHFGAPAEGLRRMVDLNLKRL